MDGLMTASMSCCMTSWSWTAFDTATVFVARTSTSETKLRGGDSGSSRSNWFSRLTRHA